MLLNAFGELDGNRAHAATRPVDEDLLAGFQCSGRKETLHCELHRLGAARRPCSKVIRGDFRTNATSGAQTYSANPPQPPDPNRVLGPTIEQVYSSLHNAISAGTEGQAATPKNPGATTAISTSAQAQETADESKITIPASRSP